MRTMEISDDVLAAIVVFVELQRTPFPDDTDFLANHLPTLCAWLEELGLLSPSSAEGVEL
jgi:hypothetical protein